MNWAENRTAMPFFTTKQQPKSAFDAGLFFALLDELPSHLRDGF
jgi:hypothetical protein